MDTNANNTVAAIAGIVGQINPLIALAVSAINSARAIRDAAKAAGVTPTFLCTDHPDQVGVEGGTCPVCGKPLVASLPSDADLIATFATNSGMLTAEAGAAKLWAATLVKT